MIGAIIGDLAAWTYENDKDTFWKQLISYNFDKMELSLYAHTYFQAASINVLSVPDQDIRIVRDIGKHSKKCTFYTLRFGCSFAAVNTIKPQLL